MLVAGCAAKSAGVTGTSHGATGKSRGAAGTSQAARQLVARAAVHSARITSASATIAEQVGGPAGETISGSVRERLRPTLLMSMKLKVASGAVNETVGEIITGKAFYLSISALARETGKRWLKIPFAALSGASSSLAQLFKSLSKINPAQQTAVFAGAKDVRDIGTQLIDGVKTTQYSGSVVPSAGLAALPPRLRKELAPTLKTITGTIRFNVWIDAQGHFRKQVLHETAAGEAITTTVVFSAINQPVHIALPPASQVATVPRSLLGPASA
jgi:hypothetical protein